MVVKYGQQYNAEERPAVILHTHINHRAETPSKTETKYTISLDTAQFCSIGSRIGWVSALLYDHIISHQASYRLTGQETRFCFLIIIR